VPTAAHPDFAREVRALLRRTPWYGISLVLHILVLLVLDLIPWQVRTENRELRLEATLPDTALRPEEGADFEEPSIDELAPEIQPEEELDPDNPDPAKRESVGDLAKEFELFTPPDTLGMGKGARILKIAALPTKDVSGAGETLRTGDLDGEHRSAQQAVERRLGAGIRDTRRKRTKADIVVVRGDFDSIELVLDAYEWPHTVIDREELTRRTFPAAELLFINCARRPPPAERAKLVSVVKGFIQRGGWVVTSDWSIDPYVTDAFPDKVELVKPKRRQPDTTVTVHPVSTDDLLGGAFSRRTDSNWWIEETSTMFRVKGDVEELVTSEDLDRRYGAKTVVFRLRYGRGMVLHLLGHFYQKDGNRMGLVGMHTLINNVILARFDSGR